MSRHDTEVRRSGEGVVGVCSCRVRQTTPVMTRKEAEDWCDRHLRQVARAQANPGRHLSDAGYVEYLREMAADPTRAKRDRDLFAQLADEQERRLRANSGKYDTGVETDPLF